MLLPIDKADCMCHKMAITIHLSGLVTNKSFVYLDDTILLCRHKAIAKSCLDALNVS